jgi:ADP-ribose pyrophosphatase YjhB (NUDIX family)
MHALIREIQALAQTGLEYSKDPYDQERYARLRTISFEMIRQLSDVPTADIERFFVPEKGYATPKVDLRACVIEEQRVLLVKERSDGKWTLPGGWADQNESPRQGIAREVKEESGYDVAVDRLYAVKDRDRHAYTPKYPVSIYKLFFTATIIGGQPSANIEVSEIDFFDIDDLPPLSEGRVLREDILQGHRHHLSRELDVSVD